MGNPGKEYLVMARKWRPQGFEDVAGQEHVIRTLQNAVKLDRIAHAFIFSGPRGVGKTSVARILAKALNCEQGPTASPCQVCIHCREITEGIALDVHEIDGASNRGIDEVRELRENIRFLPAAARYKVYIIDEVHMLTREAFNALLKTLEEPPPHVVFIFATTETHKIPATIMSRCQCFDFRRISRREIAANLRKIAQAEGIEISDRGLSWIAAAGDGSMRDAQSVFDQMVSYAGKTVTDESVEELLGLTDRRFVTSAAAAVLAGDGAQCLRIVDEAYYAGMDMQVFYQQLLGYFRNLLLAKVVPGAEGMTEMSPEDWSLLREQSAVPSRETLQRLLEILMAEEDNLRRTQSQRLVLEMTLTRMAHLPPLIPIDEILSRMAALEQRLRSGSPAAVDGEKAPYPAAKENHATAPVREKAEADYETRVSVSDEPRGGNDWEGFKQFVRQSHPPLSSKLDPGQLLGRTGEVLRIGFPGNYVFLEDLAKQQKQTLTEMARAFFQKPALELRIEAVREEAEGNGGKAVNGSAKTQHRGDVKQEALKHPLLQKVMDVFENAEIREIIPRRPVGGEEAVNMPSD